MAKEEVILSIEIDENDVKEKLGQVSKALSDLKADNARLRKELKEGSGDWAENSAKIAENNLAIKSYKSAGKTLENQLILLTKENRTYGNSLNEQRNQLEDLKAQYASLTEEQRNSAQGKELLKSLQSLSKQVTSTEQSMGVFNRNVGNYGEVAVRLSGNFRDMQKQIKELTGTNVVLQNQIKESTKVLSEMAVTTGKNNEEYVKLESSIVEMTKRLGNGEEALNALTTAAGQVKDALEESQAAVNYVANDTATLNSLISTVQFGTAVFGAYKSAVVMLGLSSEEYEDVMKSMAVTLTLLNSLQQIQNALQKESSMMLGLAKLQSKALSVANTLQAKSWIGAGTAMKAFNAIAKANPLVLIASAIAAVVLGIYAFTSSTKDAKKAQEDFNKELDANIALYEAKKIYDDANLDALNKEIELMKLRGEKEEDIRKAEKEAAKERLNNAKKQRIEHEQQIEEYDKLAEEIKRIQEEQEERKKIIANWDPEKKGLFGYKKALDDATKYLEEKNKELKERGGLVIPIRTEEAAAKHALNVIASTEIGTAQKTNEKNLENWKKLNEEKKKNSLDIHKQLEDELIKLNNQGLELEIAQEQKSTERRIAELKKVTNLTKEAKEAQAKLIESIEKNSQSKIDDIRKKYSEEETKKRVDEEQKRISLLLEIAKKGSESEYKLRLEQIELLRKEEVRKAGEAQEEIALINEKYKQQIEDLDKERIQKDQKEVTQIIKNEFAQRLLDAGENAIEVAQINLDQKQQELFDLENMDAATKAAMFETDAEYMAAMIDKRKDLKDAEKAVRDAIQANVQTQLSAIAQMSEAAQGFIEAFAAESEEMAAFAKALALFNVAVNTAKGISAAIAAGAAAGPPPANLIAIATGVSAVLSAMVQAKQILQQEPPKYATGGIVPGRSFSGDKVPIMANSAEMILNTRQQRQLFDQINSGGFTSQNNFAMLGKIFKEAFENLPPPVMDYQEFTQFSEKTSTFKEDTGIAL